MHAFVTRHRFVVVAILLLSIFAFLGLYARRWLADDGARSVAQPSHAQGRLEGRLSDPRAI